MGTARMNSLLLVCFLCPPVDCAEIYYNDNYIIACIDGRAVEPVTMPCDGAVRIDIDYDPLECATARN